MAGQRWKLSLMCDILKLHAFRLVDLQRATGAAPSRLLPELSRMVELGLLQVGQNSNSGKLYRVTPKGEKGLAKGEEILSLMAGLPELAQR